MFTLKLLLTIPYIKPFHSKSEISELNLIRCTSVLGIVLATCLPKTRKNKSVLCYYIV